MIPRAPVLRTALTLLALAAFLAACQSGGSGDADRDVPTEASEVKPLLTGTAIPASTLQTVEGDSVALRGLISQAPTVLIFYRGGWCPYCNRHLAELQRIESQLTDIGYQILAISADRPEMLQELRLDRAPEYTLLSDASMQTARDFGLAFRVDLETVQRYRENGMDLEERSGYDHHQLPVPAVFLVNPDGTVTFQYVHPDYRNRIDSDVLLAAARAYHPDAGE
ncbi:MAG: peroxiredoxin-like family protein [Balneolaceae bacterium]|nr:peroxiredoxin-like family protein [Balneolaceae bacterium]